MAENNFYLELLNNSNLANISNEEKEMMQIKLWTLLGNVTERYTMGDSSSVPVEIAEELLKSITFLLNKEDKDKMDQLLSQLGMTFSGALNMFVKQSVREQALPLNLSLKTSGSNLLDDINGNANISKPYDNVRDLFEDLLNE